MLDWLLGRKKGATEPGGAALRAAAKREVPLYARLVARPTRTLPDDLAAQEQGETHRREIDACLRELSRAPVPSNDAVVLTSLVSGPKGVVTIHAADGERAALHFSSPLRAADYRDAAGDGAARWQYIALTIPGMLRMLRDLERMGITSFCLDRCPRCDLAVFIQSGTVATAEQVWAALQVSAANKLARSRLYLTYALSAACAGRITEALEVALECAGHVTLEDPNVHLLLGRIGVALKDPVLADEARALLMLIGARAYAEKLDQAVASGATDFERR